MSKYTEAEVLNAIKTMGLFRTPYPHDVVEKVVNNILQIADRLEQADAELHDTILYDLDCMAGVPNSDSFIQGYNQALADMRGDNNGKE